VVGEAATCEEAVRLVTELGPDVVLMDLVLPGPDGVEATRRILQVRPATRVVVLTSFSNDDLLHLALEAGALSYLLKDTHPRDLAAAVRLAVRGRAVLSPAIAPKLNREAQPHGLSERELEVLRLVAAGHGNGVIAERLGISELTVKKHVSSILGKLQLADRTQAAVYAWRRRLVTDKGGRHTCARSTKAFRHSAPVASSCRRTGGSTSSGAWRCTCSPGGSSSSWQRSRWPRSPWYCTGPTT
jgi:NarL family two-component system response regulator LiaR